MSDVANDSFPSSDLTYDYEPVSPFDPSDNPGRRAMILLALTFGGLLLLAILVFQLYKPGVRDRDDAPFIAASDQPFKVVPAESDGTQTPDQDREVYDSLDGSAGDTVVTVPPTEAPIEVPDILPDRVPINVQPSRPQPPEEVVQTPAPTETPATQPSRPVDTIPRSEPAASTPAAGGSSEWVVQVASLRSEAEAQATWSRISSRFASNLPGSAYADIQRADLGDRGIYFRVRAAGLADRAAANRLCQTLKAADQGCFVTRR